MKRGSFRQIGRHRRGVALITALWVVLILSTITVGVWNFVVSSAAAAETERGYIRAGYLARAAANWQLNRLGRALITNLDNSPWHLTRDDINQTTHYITAGNKDDPTVQAFMPDLDSGVRGWIEVWSYTPSVRTWVSPEPCITFAIGHDPDTGIERELRVPTAQAYITDNFNVYGENGITFTGSGNHTCILNGLVGSNGVLDFTGPPPSAPTTVMACRMGPAATIPKGINAWDPSWDFQALNNKTWWPYVSDITTISYKGTPASLAVATTLDSQLMQYLTADGTWHMFPSSPTSLDDDQFKLSDYAIGGKHYRVVRLCEPVSGANTNIFYFNHINMGPNDILMLDTAKLTSWPIRILFDGTPAKPLVITNLCYYSTKIAGQSAATFIAWWNNTGSPITFAPTAAPVSFDLPDKSLITNNDHYTVNPSRTLSGDLGQTDYLAGYVYGINTNGGGDIVVKGNATVGTVSIGELISSHVTLDSTGGDILLAASVAAFEMDDNRKYTLYFNAAGEKEMGVSRTNTPSGPGLPW